MIEHTRNLYSETNLLTTSKFNLYHSIDTADVFMPFMKSPPFKFLIPSLLDLIFNLTSQHLILLGFTEVILSDSRWLDVDCFAIQCFISFFILLLHISLCQALVTDTFPVLIIASKFFSDNFIYCI